MGDVALQLESVTRRFGRVTALDGASLSVRRGTVHALLGENGAGKTTLMRIAFGMLRCDSGIVRVNDIQRHFHSPSDAMRAGIGMVHQHFTLVPAMTVAENIALGQRGMFRPHTVSARVEAMAARSGLPIQADARVADLPVSAQQRVEILKALARDASILILDEPTAVLSGTEARELLQKTREVVGAGGTVVLITHKLHDALEFADDVTVLRRGRTVLAERAADVSQEHLITAMVGDMPHRASVADDGPGAVRRAGRDGAVVISLDGVSAHDARGVMRLRDARLQVRAGEIVGVAAVEGSGQHELLRVLSGRLKPSSGTAIIPSVVGFVPEDRWRDALVRSFTLTENVALMGAGTRSGVMHWKDARIATERILSEYDVRAGGAGGAATYASTLSGGNQQKLVLGRELHAARHALVVENPARGLDVRAAAFVHDQLLHARDAGAAVVMYSSDLDDVLALSDRVVVLYEGRLFETALDRDAVSRAMLGAVAT